MNDRAHDMMTAPVTDNDGRDLNSIHTSQRLNIFAAHWRLPLELIGYIFGCRSTAMSTDVKLAKIATLNISLNISPRHSWTSILRWIFRCKINEKLTKHSPQPRVVKIKKKIPYIGIHVCRWNTSGGCFAISSNSAKCANVSPTLISEILRNFWTNIKRNIQLCTNISVNDSANHSLAKFSPTSRRCYESMSLGPLTIWTICLKSALNWNVTRTCLCIASILDDKFLWNVAQNTVSDLNMHHGTCVTARWRWFWLIIYNVAGPRFPISTPMPLQAQRIYRSSCGPIETASLRTAKTNSIEIPLGCFQVNHRFSQRYPLRVICSSQIIPHRHISISTLSVT